jgi:hypothetical protein
LKITLEPAALAGAAYAMTMSKAEKFSPGQNAPDIRKIVRNISLLGVYDD